MNTVLKVVRNEPVGDLQPQGHSSHNTIVTADQKAGHLFSDKVQHGQGQRPKKPAAKKDNLQARYWSYLFDNLHRAVEELYTTCEADESVVECQEVVMSLEMCCKDFVALIQRIELQKQFEGGKRPPSVAWEVRKITSPSKPFANQHTRPFVEGTKYNKPATQAGAKRWLDFKVSQKNTETHFETQTPPTVLTTTGSATPLTSTCTESSKIHISMPAESCVQSAAPVRLGVGAQGGPVTTSVSQSNEPKLVTKPTGQVAPQTLSWADRVKGKVPKDLEVRCHPVTSTTSTCGTRNELKNNAIPPSASAIKGNVPGAHSRTRAGRRFRRVRSNKAGEVSRCAVHTQEKVPNSSATHSHPVKAGAGGKSTDVSSTLFRASSDPGFSMIQDGELTLKKSSSVIEEAMSAVEQSVSSASLEMACLVTEPEGALPGSRGTTPSPQLKDRTCPGESADPASISVPRVEVSHPSSPKREEFKPVDPSVMELSPKQSLDWNTFVAVCEANKNPICWADRSDSPPPLPEVPRSPGRAVQLHQKFSSPNRKRPIEESIRILQERQVKAQLQRGRLQEEKTHKLHLQTKKVKEVREQQDALSRQRKEEMDEKMQRAEHLRESFLQEIVKKAQAEEAKVCEIAFINSLEAQNKRIEVQQRHEDHWARLQHRQMEKQKRHQEHQAREEAAQQRHRLIEIERQARLVEKEKKRKEQDAKREQLRSERDRAREDALREKARERERKKEARNAALQMSVEELERRIQLKQDESSKRYDLQLEQIKERASSIPRHLSSDDAPCVGLYDTQKWCTLCKIKIVSPVYYLSHLRGKKHQEVVSSLTPEQSDPALVITEAPKEEQGLSKLQIQVSDRLRAGKKRARKLKQKMAGWAKEQNIFETSQSKAKPRLQKVLNELNKVIDGKQDDADVSILGHLDRILSEISRMLSSKVPDDLVCFCQLGGVSMLIQLLVVFTRQVVLSRPLEKLAQLTHKYINQFCGSTFAFPNTLPHFMIRMLCMAVNILQTICSENVDICAYFILANQFVPVVELLVQYLTIPHPKPHPRADMCADLAPPMEKQLCLLHSASLSLCPPLLSLLSTILSRLSCCAKYHHLESTVFNCIGLLVSVGVVDRLSDCFAAVLVPITVPELEQLVIGGINLLIATTGYLHRRVVHVFGDPPEDTTQLLLVLRQTELSSLLALLYAILLHDGPPRHSTVPPALSTHTLALATAAFKAVNNAAIIDLKMVQACLGAEGVSLEFRHVVSYLLWHCSHYPNSALLQELILSIGYCCVLNPDNQVFLQSGRSPTLLQLMCGLPFEYFTKPELTCLLYPTLIAACYNSQENVGILSQEISCKLLSTFLQESMQLFKEESKGVPDFYSLPYRFPKCHWTLALQFFSN